MTPLLFDMDGLLLDTERVAMQSFCELAVDLGLAVDRAEREFLGLIGSSADRTRKKLATILPVGADIDRFDQNWSARFRQLIEPGIPLRPFASQVVASLAGRGHAMAVVTSTRGAPARTQLERVGLLGHFRGVVGGDEVGATKPDPAPYLAGAALLGVQASDCVAFEDSDTGVASAIAAGCRVIQIPDLRPPATPVPRLGQAIARDLMDALHMAGIALH